MNEHFDLTYKSLFRRYYTNLLFYATRIVGLEEAENSVTLTGLAIAAIAGVLLNVILPGNDYQFGKNLQGDINRGVAINPNPKKRQE